MLCSRSPFGDLDTICTECSFPLTCNTNGTSTIDSFGNCVCHPTHSGPQCETILPCSGQGRLALVDTFSTVPNSQTQTYKGTGGGGTIYPCICTPQAIGTQCENLCGSPIVPERLQIIEIVSTYNAIFTDGTLRPNGRLTFSNPPTMRTGFPKSDQTNYNPVWVNQERLWYDSDELFTPTTGYYNGGDPDYGSPPQLQIGFRRFISTTGIESMEMVVAYYKYKKGLYADLSDDTEAMGGAEDREFFVGYMTFETPVNACFQINNIFGYNMPFAFQMQDFYTDLSSGEIATDTFQFCFGTCIDFDDDGSVVVTESTGGGSGTNIDWANPSGIALLRNLEDELDLNFIVSPLGGLELVGDLIDNGGELVDDIIDTVTPGCLIS